ncbi:DUF624 domain-containing protein [Agromyces sp. NPDC049794]|uniref:YesL family protein n=1 Tax=unclassified Agromyces TaxID=2639701 RepID=UPI003400E121
MSTSGTTAPTWALRAHQVTDWVLWIMAVNLAWLAFTLLGGVVFGVAPATIAAAVLTRRRLAGDGFRFVSEFSSTWRREFLRANLVLLPVFAVAVLLGVNLASFARLGMHLPAILSGVAFTIVAVVALVLVPLYAHYDLPLRRYATTALRFAVANPAAALLLAVTTVLIVGVTTVLPGLLPFVTVGAVLVSDTALGLAFFRTNDRRVLERGDPPDR